MHIEDRVSVMAKSFLFEGTSVRLLREIADHSVERRLPAGTLVADEDERCTDLCLIVEGQVGFIANINGLEQVVLMMGPGDWYNIVSLVANPTSRSHKRTAAEVLSLSVDAATVKHLLEENSEDGFCVTSRLSTLLADRYTALLQVIRENLRREFHQLENQAIRPGEHTTRL